MAHPLRLAFSDRSVINHAHSAELTAIGEILDSEPRIGQLAAIGKSIHALRQGTSSWSGISPGRASGERRARECGFLMARVAPRGLSPLWFGMTNDPIPALKRQLADGILHAVDELNFFVAAGVLDIDPARLSDLRRGRIARFSVDSLIRLLAKVNRRVDVSVVNTGPRHLPWFRILRERAQARTRP